MARKLSTLNCGPAGGYPVEQPCIDEITLYNIGPRETAKKPVVRLPSKRYANKHIMLSSLHSMLMRFGDIEDTHLSIWRTV